MRDLSHGRLSALAGAAESFPVHEGIKSGPGMVPAPEIWFSVEDGIKSVPRIECLPSNRRVHRSCRPHGLREAR